MKQMVLLKDDFRDTALHLSACQGEVGIVKLLLARGADVDAENNLGSTPLNRAAVAGKTEVQKACEHSQHVFPYDRQLVWFAQVNVP